MARTAGHAKMPDLRPTLRHAKRAGLLTRVLGKIRGADAAASKHGERIEPLVPMIELP